MNINYYDRDKQFPARFFQVSLKQPNQRLLTWMLLKKELHDEESAKIIEDSIEDQLTNTKLWEVNLQLLWLLINDIRTIVVEARHLTFIAD